MADVFISYKREDIVLAKSIAASLEVNGLSVWWDHNIPAGKDYDQVIAEELLRAKCVVVLWSVHSVNSRNVKDEANEGLKRNLLIPVLIGKVVPPLGFRMIQGIQWNEDDQVAPGEINELTLQIKRLIGDSVQNRNPSLEFVPGNKPGNFSIISLYKDYPREEKSKSKSIALSVWTLLGLGCVFCFIVLLGNVIKPDHVPEVKAKTIDSVRVSRLSNDRSIRIVTSDKVYFYNQPGLDVRKAYLIKGDIFTVLIERNGYAYTEFTNKGGIVTKGWINLADAEVY